MNRIAKLFLWTFVVSFAGSLPLGSLNVSITKLAVSKGGNSAFFFGLGAILVELLLVRLAVEGVERLERIKRFMVLFHWVTSFVLLVFAVFSIAAALQMKRFGSTVLFVGRNPFAAGLFLSVLNPLHLPFWLGWTTAFQAKGIMRSSKTDYNVYVSAIGLGTSLAFVLYGIVGRVFISFLESKQFLLHWAVGLTLLGTAAWQVKKIFRKQGSPAFVKLQNK